MLHRYKVKVHHDKGFVNLVTWAENTTEAKLNIMQREKCPACSIRSLDYDKPKNASELKSWIEGLGQIGEHFFAHKTMRFFGDTMANYGVRSFGNYWELYRRKPVKHGLKESAYFNKETLKREYAIEED